jgi:inward rectifier potassium channel
LSWSLFHRVDASSPLYGLTAADLARDGAGLMLLINGFDETYGQDIRARHYYEHEDLRWNHRYSDIFSRPAQGPELVDFGKFHEVEPMAD